MITNATTNNLLYGIKAPIVLPERKNYRYQGACVFRHENGYSLITSRLTGNSSALCISESTDLTGWTKPNEIFDTCFPDGLGVPGSGVLFNGLYLFCSCSEHGTYLISSRDLKNFTSLGKMLLPESSFPFVPVLTADREDPKRLWCLYGSSGLSTAWTEDLKNWHSACSTDIRADSVAIVSGRPLDSAASGYTVLLTQDGTIRRYETDSMESFSLSPTTDRPELSSTGNRCLAAGSVFHDPATGFYQMYYTSSDYADRTPAYSGDISLAVSPDLTHWQFFIRDIATFPDNGIIYEGDYYKAIPFSQYIRDTALPDDAPVFDIRRYGAIADGTTLCTEAFRAAAADVKKAGGGIILVSGGYYCTGTVSLPSNTTLWIERDSALVASKDLSLYEDALVKCVNAHNVSIQGGGKIIGNGEYFVYLPLKAPLTDPLKKTKLPPHLYDPMGYPVDTIRYSYRCRIRYAEDKYGEGLTPINRPMYTVWLRNSREVKVSNIIIEDALDWTLVVDCSHRVTIQDVVINGNRHVANTDGIDIMGSSQVDIRHCFVSCADDGICIKSPLKQGHDGINIRETDSAMAGTTDIHISDCTVVSVMNAFKIGTETYYDISNITIENCRFMMPDIYPGSVSGISIESADGSHVRHIRVRNIEMDKVCCPVFICLNMRNKYGFIDEKDREERYYGGAIEDVIIENITALQVEVPSIITGFRITEGENSAERCVKDITIRRFRAIYRDNEEDLSPQDQIYENILDYPENNAFGDVPAYGFYIRHADHMTLEDYQIIPRTSNNRPCVTTE